MSEGEVVFRYRVWPARNGYWKWEAASDNLSHTLLYPVQSIKGTQEDAVKQALAFIEMESARERAEWVKA